ncbi:MAG: bifunctional oligoribonuclease/PAP phosphatase NrnA [Anaerolineales bacterium]
MTDFAVLPAIAKSIAQAENILLVSHIRPDGDAIGSLLGLGWALEGAGKRVQMVVSDGVPKALAFLPGSSRVQKAVSAPYDLSIVLDCSELSRSGNALTEERRPDINIDHHPTNDSFAKINLVRPDAVATAEILASSLPALGLPMPPESASALMTGLLTDTLGLRTPNMHPEVLRLAASLMEHGANLPELYFQAMVQRDFLAARLWGDGLSRLQRAGRVVWTSLTLEDKARIQYPGRDDADLINVLSSISDADIAVIFVEQNTDKVKISWRSRDGIDISQLAVSFGGGGHKNAAGAEVDGSLHEVETRVIEATQESWNRQAAQGIAQPVIVA